MGLQVKKNDYDTTFIIIPNPVAKVNCNNLSH